MTERKWLTLSEAVDELMEQVLREHQERLAREQALVRLATEQAEKQKGERHG
jgi:hypothetical protein